MALTDFTVQSLHPPPDAALRLAGELDLASAPDLRERITALLDRAPHRLTLELSELDFIDSSGLGVLISAARQAALNGTVLVLAGATRPIVKAFEVTGTTGLFLFEGQQN